MFRILLVEDDILLSLTTSLMLEAAGYHVTVACDGQEGLAAALDAPLEMVVTDFMMPRMNGLEMTRALRDSGFAGPVIVATAVPEADLLKEAVRFDRLLSKPYDEKALLAAVRACHPDEDGTS